MDSLQSNLSRLFGHNDFRPGQREIVESVLEGRDTLAILPTGGGKSLTYQLPAMLVPGATLVLSPLIALMKDQAENLPPEVAERTAIVNSSLSPSEVRRRLSLVKSGHIKMVYAAPERLRQAPFLHALRHAGVSLVVVDEAHCISQWGHDFRPDYRAVGKAIASLSPRMVLAATATATADVQDDIERQVGRVMNRIVRPTFRDNLLLCCEKVKGEDEKLQTTLDLCRDTPGSGLVYAGSRDKCEQLSRMLVRHGVDAGFYHAGLPAEDRARAQDRFMAGDVRVMVATVAFGMGVDKSDIRFLVHYHPSRTLENYYQEAGRAGRDGAPARCTLLFSTADATNAARHLREDAMTFEDVKAVYAGVRGIVGRRRVGAVSIDAIAAAMGGEDTLARAALPLLEETGLITRHVDIPRSLGLSLEFSADEEDPRDASESDVAADAGWAAFADAASSGAWDPTDLSRATGVPLADLEDRLLTYQQLGRLTYQAAPREMTIELLAAPADTVDRLKEVLAHRARSAELRVAAMQDYARANRCRHGQIARYFGDRWPGVKCGMCDVCSPSSARTADASQADAQPGVISENPPLSALQLVRDLAAGYRPFAVGKPGLVRALRGTPDAPVKADRTATFGALAGMKKGEIERMVETLIETGYFRREDDDDYRRLYLTGEGKAAVAGGEIDIAWKMPTATRSAAVATETLEPGDAALLDALKQWRRETAIQANVPPYVVFADKVLGAIAASRPTNEFDLLGIAGIGPAKTARYAVDVLRILESHGARP